MIFYQNTLSRWAIELETTKNVLQFTCRLNRRNTVFAVISTVALVMPGWDLGSSFLFLLIWDNPGWKAILLKATKKVVCAINVFHASWSNAWFRTTLREGKTKNIETNQNWNKTQHTSNKSKFYLSTRILLSDFADKRGMGRCHLSGLEYSIWYWARWKLLVQVEKVRIKIRIAK